jgi:GntR family transcriptional regulator/MocR family aminotransferase
MPLERRLALLELAARRGFVIVEDDYEFELSFKRSPSPALKSLDQGGAVIYVGSFSKSLAPGLRLGYLVASKPFIREARALRSLIMRHPPGSIQRTAAYFLSLGHYDTQINTIRKAYQSRRSTMEAAMLEHGLIQACPSTAGGSSFWMRAPNGVDTGVLARRLYRRGVVIEPGQVFFAARTPPSCFYRLAYSSIPGASIAEGIARISQEINQTGPTSTS